MNCVRLVDQIIRIKLCFLNILFACTGLHGQPSDESIEQLVSHADLIYSTPVKRSEEGMPFGNGTMGSLVWTTPTAFHLQLNRVDVFAMNASSNNFYQRHTDYCNGVAFLEIDFSTGMEDVFTEPHFSQHLSCYQGAITTKGKNIQITSSARMSDDVFVIEVEDNRESPAPVSINLRTLRAPVTRRGDHLAVSRVEVVNDQILLKQEFAEGTYYSGSAAVVGITGRTGKAVWANESEVKIIVTPGRGKFTIFIASDASMEKDVDISQRTITKCREAMKLGADRLTAMNLEWWTNFWKKSYVHLHSTDGVADVIEKNYTYYLYIMASSSRGRYPAKFNGMLWSTGGDERKWGSLYWGANQSCLYNALFMTNHIELLDPMFNMYTSMQASCEDAAVRQWGSNGIYIPETVAFDGLGYLPDSIAAEMQALYLLKKPWKDRTAAFETYASTKLPFLSRWNWKKDEGWKEGKWMTSDKGGGPFGHVTHIFSRGAKLAYQYWLKYEYTRDMDWLRNNAYPMLKGVAEFYRNFPNVKRDADGRFHIYHINDNESVWDGHNTIEEISAIKGVLPVAIKAAELLNVDKDLQRSWKDFLDHLSPLPVNMDDENVTWKKSLSPVLHGDPDRIPDPNTLPVWFFDLCNLESSQEMKQIANATFDGYFPSGINKETPVYVLSKLPVAGSLLGRKESTQYLIPNQIQSKESTVMANRMDLREGEQTTSIQRLGRAAEALQYALCQSVPSAPGEETVIHLFPAWPDEWEAQFSLLARGGFVVRSKFQDGVAKFVTISSEKGSKCELRNPWPRHQVVIYRNGKQWKKTDAAVITFDTSPGDNFLIIPSSQNQNKVDSSLRIER